MRNSLLVGKGENIFEEFLIVTCKSIKNKETKKEEYTVEVKERYSFTHECKDEQIQKLTSFCFPNKSFVTTAELKFIFLLFFYFFSFILNIIFYLYKKKRIINQMK